MSQFLTHALLAALTQPGASAVIGNGTWWKVWQIPTQNYHREQRRRRREKKNFCRCANVEKKVSMQERDASLRTQS